MKPRVATFAAIFASILTVAATPAPTPNLSGVWQGSATVQGAAIPFRLRLDQGGGAVRASFFDGERPTNPSAPGTILNDHLHLSFPSYGATLDATVGDGRLDGSYVRNGRAIPISAVKGVAPAPATGPAPKIAGQWIVTGVQAKGETAWRLVVRQHGPRAEATILRVDGDTGTLSGTYADGTFRLSHFAGERPALLVIRRVSPQKLALSLSDGDGQSELTALSPAAARVAGAAPADPNRFSGVANDAERFRFAFPDLSGHPVANTDKRFRGKVLVVDVMGSWCPNCHDEAPFLEALYRKHHAQGLEVVALDFEQPDQLADPQRSRAFVASYGITYPVLLAGTPAEATQKLPQARNLAAWPTTFFIGRDGRVKAVHVGFTSPGSGSLDVKTRAEAERQVQSLLAAKAG